MKKYSILVLVLVLTVLALTGCWNRKNKMEPTTVPTTEMTTAPTTMPTTEATHQPTENTAGANDHTNPGTIPGDADPTATDSTAATGEGRARHMPRNR